MTNALWVWELSSLLACLAIGYMFIRIFICTKRNKRDKNS